MEELLTRLPAAALACVVVLIILLRYMKSRDDAQAAALRDLASAVTEDTKATEKLAGMFGAMIEYLRNGRR